MAGFMDMFRTAPQAPAPAPAAPAVPATGGVTVPEVTQVPAGQMPGTAQQPVNVLDAYSKLFDNSGKAPDVAPAFILDPKTLSEAAGTMNFTQGIPQELMTRATTGDAAALVEVMNLVGRSAYQSSLAHSSALTDRFVAARSEFDLKGVGAKVTQQLTNSALADAPNYQHPVVKAEFSRIANAFQAQNPDSSPAEIAAATRGYMQNLQTALNPTTAAANPAAPAATNWEQWMST